MAHLGGTTIPTSIDNHGRYLYQKEVLRTNGDGEAVVSNYATITWTFELMAMSDYEWIITTLMSGAYSLKVGSASLYDDKGDAITPSNVVVQRPTYEYASGGYVYNVTWLLERVR